MPKDFDRWNEQKKKIDIREKLIFCNQREIWWCSLGLNIGVEEDGKNQLFERPVLVIKVFNDRMLRVAPLTGKIKEDQHHVTINYNNRNGSVILSQLKTISSKRLSRKLCRLEEKEFNKVIEKLKQNID